jgi:hypothetical protein
MKTFVISNSIKFLGARPFLFLPFSSFSTTAKRSQSLHKSRSGLGVRLSNLTSIYNFTSPTFQKLFEILTNEPLNRTTQLKIEKFLLDQAAEYNKEKLESNKNYSHNKISNAITLELVELQKILEKLIKNYQTNLKLEEVELPGLALRIMSSMNYKFLVSISYGRILNILNTGQQKCKKNNLLDISIELGKEIINKYILDSYQVFLKKSLNKMQIPENKNTTTVQSRASL